MFFADVTNHRKTGGTGDLNCGTWLPDGVRVGWGVSELLAAFCTTLAVV
jgi:hypothetical protein